MLKFIRNLFKGRKQQYNIPVVNHSISKKEEWAYKDKAWRNPYCQIIETATSKIIKNFGETVYRTF